MGKGKTLNELFKKAFEKAFEGDAPKLPGPKVVAAIAAGGYLLYEQLKERGLVIVARVRHYDGVTHVDHHVDFDDDKYDGLVSYARLIKDDIAAEEHLHRRNGSSTDDIQTEEE